MTEAHHGPHIVVVVNGEFSHPSRLLALVDEADRVIAADGGANWLFAHDRLPDLLVGDMDSIAPEVLRALEQRHCRVQRYPQDKDETDTELALLEALQMGARRITILGALGGRLDHALANVLLLSMPALDGTQAVIFDGVSYTSVLRGQGVVRGQAGDTVSLIPLGGDAEGITTEGFQYPLEGEPLFMGAARGVSNVLLGSVGHITVRRGTLLVVHTPTRDTRCTVD